MWSTPTRRLPWPSPSAKGQAKLKLRHINVSPWWIQERQDKKDLECGKVLGTENPADMMTKNVAEKVILKYFDMLQTYFSVERAKGALELAT